MAFYLSLFVELSKMLAIQEINQIMVADKDKQYLIKTTPPYNVVLLGLIMLLLIVASFFNWVWIVYSIPFCIMYYIQFSRYSCVITITGQYLKIYYFAPWNKNIEIKIESIKGIDYLTGFYIYNLFSDKKLGGFYTFPKYCYDQLTVFLSGSEQSFIDINVNTRMFYFKKILKVFKRLKLLNEKL